MSEHVYWILETEIKEGEYDNLISLMNEMVEATKANEPGALNYEWNVSEDKKTCTLFERYADSEATMVHLGNFGKNYAPRFMGMLKTKSFIVYGNPDESVHKALGGLGVTFMNSLGGFSR